MQQALRLQPVYPQALEAGARLAWLRGDTAAAAGLWQAAHAADRRSVPALVGMAVVLEQQGRRAEGQPWMDAAVAIDTRAVDAHLGLLRDLWARFGPR